MNKDRFDSIAIGDEAEIFHTISENDVNSFAELTGDINPLHMDEIFAAKTSFKHRVVHGMLTASFISTMIGTKLPGAGSLWYEQRLYFMAPARIGERIRILARVKQKSLSQRILQLETLVFGENERKLIEGEAKVKLLDPNITGDHLSEEIAQRAFKVSEVSHEAEIPEVKRKQVFKENHKGAIIVTGGSRGIGAAIAIDLALNGFPVVVNYINNASKANDVVNKIKANNGKAIAYRADVTDNSALISMVDFTVNKFNSIFGAVNNATPPLVNLAFSQMSWADIQNQTDVQIKGAFQLCKSIMPYLLAAQKGVIVNIASIYADNVPPINMMPYVIAKSALVAFSRSLAVEYGSKGININCVSPGMTQTELIANVPEKTKLLAKMHTPLRRLGLPEDIAGVVSFLFSDKAQHITGENIRVCGGIIMR
ncbi:MAG: SDR family oxidoreductase [Desulfobaccales bacterium]